MPTAAGQVLSRRTVNRHIVQNQQEASNIRIAQQTKLIFQDYAKRKLYIAGFNTTDGTQTPSDVAFAVQQMAFSLETNYPNLYTNIARQVNTSFTNEPTVCEIFTDFAQAIFRDGISWNRIIALFTFSGALALECYELGAFRHPVNKVSDWISHFTSQFLAEWIQQQGGWDAFLEVFPVQTTHPSTWSRFIQFLCEWIKYFCRIRTSESTPRPSLQAETRSS